MSCLIAIKYRFVRKRNKFLSLTCHFEFIVCASKTWLHLYVVHQPAPTNALSAFLVFAFSCLTFLVYKLYTLWIRVILDINMFLQLCLIFPFYSSSRKIRRMLWNIAQGCASCYKNCYKCWILICLCDS